MEKWGLRGRRPTLKHLGLQYSQSQNTCTDPSPSLRTPGRRRRTHRPSATPTARGCRGSLRPAARPGLRGAQRSPAAQAGAAAWPGGAHSPRSRPLSLLPHHQASPRSRSPFSPFPLSPLPPDTHKTRPPPPHPRTPPTFPCPRLCPPLRSTQKLQARRLLSTAPIFPSRVLSSHRRGAASRGGGEEPGRPPQRRVCTLMLPGFPERERKKGARQGSARAAAAALSTAPRWSGLARRQRLLPSRRLLPRRPASPAQFLIQPLPLTQRRRDTGRALPPPRAARRSPCAGPDPAPAPPPGPWRKEMGAPPRPLLGDPREICLASPRDLQRKGRPAPHSNGTLSRAGGPGSPRGGCEATSDNIGAGVVGTTFCGSAGPPPAPLFVRLPPAGPGAAPGPRRPPPGDPPGGRGGPGAAELQVLPPGATRIPTRG